MHPLILNVLKITLLGGTLMSCVLALDWAVDRMYRRWWCGFRRKP